MGCLNHSDPASLLLLDQNSVFCCICWNIFVTTVSATIPLSLYISTEGTLSFAAFFVYYFYIIIHSPFTASSFWRTNTLLDYVKLEIKATHTFVGVTDT